MEKFLLVIILLGPVRKGKTRDYWRTSKLTDTPIYDKLMSRNRFKQIRNFWHFSDNPILDDEAGYTKSG
jgi:hypothetical protein